VTNSPPPSLKDCRDANKPRLPVEACGRCCGSGGGFIADGVLLSATRQSSIALKARALSNGDSLLGVWIVAACVPEETLTLDANNVLPTPAEHEVDFRDHFIKSTFPT